MEKIFYELGENTETWWLQTISIPRLNPGIEKSTSGKTSLIWIKSGV